MDKGLLSQIQINLRVQPTVPLKLYRLTFHLPKFVFRNINTRFGPTSMNRQDIQDIQQMTFHLSHCREQLNKAKHQVFCNTAQSASLRRCSLLVNLCIYAPPSKKNRQVEQCFAENSKGSRLGTITEQK